ncbi:unnamed protein product (mitochondrion) [Musa acuminata var. zebrina]
MGNRNLKLGTSLHWTTRFSVVWMPVLKSVSSSSLQVECWVIGYQRILPNYGLDVAPLVNGKSVPPSSREAALKSE